MAGEPAFGRRAIPKDGSAVVSFLETGHELRMQVG